MKNWYTLLSSLFVFFIQPVAGQVVINEAYGGGGNTGAVYKNDFVELYNNGPASVDLTGWSIQYASATGTTWGGTALTPLSGSIASKGYYLVKMAAGTAGTLELPDPDATGSTAMGAGAGKLILCNTTVAQTGSNPSGPQIIDKLGYGPTANGFEGTGPSPAPTNTTSVQRTPEGFDSDNNAADFTAGSASPKNAGLGTDIIPPQITALSPLNNALNVDISLPLTITFNENIVITSGLIKITNGTTGGFDYVDAQSPNVVAAANTVVISGVNLQPATGYSVTIGDTVLQDAAGNRFGGLSNTDWTFTTASVATELPGGVLNSTYTLNSCETTFGSNGFTQYSVRGGFTWACTTFGRDAANLPKGSAPAGLQINGYDNALQSNVTNEDWLITPAFDLTGTSYPLLSFWSRTRFNGQPLQLKVSTNFPGKGDPRNYSWTDLNGRFPAATSDSWTLSSNINLAAFAGSRVYIAFVYVSSEEEGARWTLDDIRIDNSPVPPPPGLNLSTGDIQFGYTASGSTATKTLLVTGNDITGDITLTASANFSLSADSLTYSSSLVLVRSVSNNIPRPVYIRFEPVQDSTNFTGVITVSTAGVPDTVVTLKGTTIDPLNTLEVVNWNLEWFGSPQNGPPNDNLQEQHVKTILQSIGADIYGLLEVVDTARLGSIVRQMPGYTYVAGNYGSNTNPPNPGGFPLSEAQKLAFVYKTDLFTHVTAQPLFDTASTSSATYNNWSSGRYPYMLTADVTLNGISKTVRFVLLHSKANTSPTITSYNRRKNGADELYALLNAAYPEDNIIILGDFNDDLDRTITDGITPPTTSYISFINDTVRYNPVTLSLSNAGKASTVTYSDMIDHVIISNEMLPYYIDNSASVLSDVSTLVSSYGSTTTDHYPVFTRYRFSANGSLPVSLTYFTGVPEKESVRLNWASVVEVNSKSFVIERAADGVHFKPIGEIKAGGNAAGVYSFTDAHPVRGNNFYRLNMVDKDGKQEYSKLIKVYFGRALLLRLNPNPAREAVSVSLEGFTGPVMVQLMDTRGQTVIKQSFTGGSAHTLRVGGVKRGVYFIKVSGNAEEVVQKLVIE